MSTRNAYITALINHQTQENWSDRRMASELGLAPTTWFRIRTGTRGMGTHVLRACMARFPEYNALALLFLLSDATQGSDSDTNGKAA